MQITESAFFMKVIQENLPSGLKTGFSSSGMHTTPINYIIETDFG